VDSPRLILQDVLGDAIVTQLAADGITAEVTTNPTQGGNYPFVVIGEDAATGEDLNRDNIRTSVAHNVYVHSGSMTECKQVAESALKAIGPGGSSLDLGAGFYEVLRELEADDLTREPRPEGFLYHNLIRVRYLISTV
jgi:hypothetical protein